MKYAKCKCGQSEFWGSGMEPNRCQPCLTCGTTKWFNPSHPLPESHEWITKYDENTGEPYKICSLCMTRMGDDFILERTHGGEPSACPYLMRFSIYDEDVEAWTDDIEKALRFGKPLKDPRGDAEKVAALVDEGCTVEVILHKPR